MKLFLIRHLQTEFNHKKVLQGSLDIPVLKPTREASSQISKNQQQLNQFMPFDAILVSELQRTQMTAEYYGFDKVIQVEKLLNELNFGNYEGQSKTKLISEQGEQWLNNPQELILGEPLTQLSARIFEFIIKYQHQHRVLVFGHGSWLRAICSISRYGNINKMNQITNIANNELLQLNL